MRLGTANTFDNTLATLSNRQSSLADLQEKLSAGKKIVRASDDPTNAAQAERAMTRLSRIEVEQRALEVQKNAISMAEATLGESVDYMKTIRDAVVNAGNASYTSVNRTTLADQIRGLRDQLFSNANKLDTNGVPLFSGLGSISNPFTDSGVAVTYTGISGQRPSTPVSIPATMNGNAVWMNVPTGNGTFNVALGAGNTGTVWTDVGQVTNPAALTGDNYTVTFTSPTTYDVLDTTTGTPVVTGAPYTDGKSITQIPGMAIPVHGTPVAGDTLQISPSTTTNVFKVLDDAIANIDGQPSDNKLTHNIQLALTQIDAAINRLQAGRSQAGDLLNRADSIGTNQETKTVQLSADRSRAEDMDMVKGISDFQNQQTAYDAALKTYAQVQRLSLFNYIG
jgi:flagellar hook-associated protein 3 FlgL